MVITMKTKILAQSPQILATLFLTFAASTEAIASPIAHADHLNTSVGVAKTVGVLWNDRGNGLHVSKVNNYSVNGGQAYVVAGRKIHYTPKPGFRGTDSFWYEIKDAHGRTNSAKVTVNVSGGGHHRAKARHHKPHYNVQWSQPGFSLSYSKPGGVQAQFGAPSNHYAQPNSGGSGPVAHPDAYNTHVSSGQSPLYVLSNDQGSGLSVLKTNPWTSNGGQAWVVNNHTGSFIMYTPKPGFRGVDELWYVLRDAHGRTNSSKATISIW